MKKYVLKNKVEGNILQVYELKSSLDESTFRLEIVWKNCEVIFESTIEELNKIDLKNSRGFIPQNQLSNVIDIKLYDILSEEFDFDFEESPMKTNFQEQQGLIAGYEIDGIQPLIDLWDWQIIENYVDIQDELQILEYEEKT